MCCLDGKVEGGGVWVGGKGWVFGRGNNVKKEALVICRKKRQSCQLTDYILTKIIVKLH